MIYNFKYRLNGICGVKISLSACKLDDEVLFLPTIMKKQILFLATFCLIALAFSQAGFDDDVVDVPVDGGIISVVGSAIAYGIYRNRKSAKSNND